jgi:hypothetical protein
VRDCNDYDSNSGVKMQFKQVGQQVKAAGHCIRYVGNKWRCEALADKMSVGEMVFKLLLPVRGFRLHPLGNQKQQ